MYVTPLPVHAHGKIFRTRLALSHPGYVPYWLLGLIDPVPACTLVWAFQTKPAPQSIWRFSSKSG